MRERERERDRELFGLELLLLGTHFRFTLLRGLFPLWRVSSFKVTKTTGGFLGLGVRVEDLGCAGLRGQAARHAFPPRVARWGPGLLSLSFPFFPFDPLYPFYPIFHYGVVWAKC